MVEKLKYRVLVLEDDQPLAKVVAEAFVDRGFDPFVVASVEDGIKELETHDRIDLIWLDHYLLGAKNGLDFVAHVKGHEEWKNIPIFVVSNTASEKNLRSYLDFGVVNFYTKPDHNIMHIINDVENLLKKSSN